MQCVCVAEAITGNTAELMEEGWPGEADFVTVRDCGSTFPLPLTLVIIATQWFQGKAGYSSSVDLREGALGYLWTKEAPL